MIAILDYGAGNLQSVAWGLARIGAPAFVTAEPAKAAEADGLVLPGVGAFADAMTALKRSGMIPVLRDAATAGTPLLGVCLGMQALFSASEEGAGVEGLGLIAGRVRRLPDCGLKIPHMGWNTLIPQKDSPLLKGLPDEPYVYFVHSYACCADDPADVLTLTEYGQPFCSAVQRGRVIGMQFHPEKSGAVGEQLLRNFVRLVEGGCG